jgi:hypothetical protein
LIAWYRLSSQFVSREPHSNEVVVGSYNRSLRVQRKRANATKENWPLDHDSDRGTGRNSVCGCYQHPVATDVHRPTHALYCLAPSDCVTGSKRDGETNSASSFWPIEGTRDVHCPFHRSSTKMNEASQRVTYFTEVEPATLIP